MKTTKYEIIHASPDRYSILEHYTLFGINMTSCVKDYLGLEEYWSSLEDAEKWVEGAIDYANHKVKVVKTYEMW